MPFASSCNRDNVKWGRGGAMGEVDADFAMLSSFPH